MRICLPFDRPASARTLERARACQATLTDDPATLHSAAIVISAVPPWPLAENCWRSSDGCPCGGWRVRAGGPGAPVVRRK